MSHGVQAGGGGDSAGLAQTIGMHQGNNLVSAVLGLNDHGGHAVHGHHGSANHAPGNAHNLPSQSAGWNSGLQGVKLSDALQGINVTPNFLFVLLFAGLTAWLGVIYWIRHHEPLANSVLGTGAAHCATAAADRRLISGTKVAIPGRTSAETGDIYVPGSSAATAAVPLPPSIPPAPAPLPEPQPTPLSAASTATFTLPEPGNFSSAFGQPDATRRAYMVPERESDGTRVKMIVNR